MGIVKIIETAPLNNEHIDAFVSGSMRFISFKMAKSRLTTQSTVWKTLDNNGLNQVVASSGFSENKGLVGMLSLTGS